jgi:uncharacterized protein YndB with AHSA1/START domain
MANASDTTTAATDRVARTFSMTLDINATPDDVWRALTDAGELVRWFPLQASVTPGSGGTMFWGWDGRFAWESTIDAWEPGSRLRLVENRPAFDVEGNPVDGTSHPMAMEFILETHAGRTRLRFVHSGFGQGASWDDELESVSAGWQFELRSLRLYLERHKGRDRHHAALHQVTTLDVAATWARLLGPDAFPLAEGELAVGERCAIAAATGDRFSGTIEWLNREHDLVLLVDDFDSGIFRMSTWFAGGKTGVQVWLTSYDPSNAERVRQFGERGQLLLDRLFTRTSVAHA